MDFAGVTPPYELDGQSWRFAVTPDAEPVHAHFFEKERCLFFEYQRDRAVRCGCGKLLRLSGIRSTFDKTTAPTTNDGLSVPTAAPTTLDEFTDGSATFAIGIQGEFFDGSVTDNDPSFLFDLCTGDGFVGDYITAAIAEDLGLSNPEAENLLETIGRNPVREQLRAAIGCFNNITAATAEPTFNRNCSLESYTPVCQQDSDCVWDSLGRTVCSGGFFCDFEVASVAAAGPADPIAEIPATGAVIDEEESERKNNTTRVILIVAVAAVAVCLAAMFLRCIAMVLVRKPER